MATKKKISKKKAPSKKIAKKATKKTSKKAPTKKSVKKATKKTASKKIAKKAIKSKTTIIKKKAFKEAKLTPFLKRQKAKLLALRDSLVDTMDGVAQSTLRSKGEEGSASAFGMHQADAGSDAYDRDFALGMLSKEQDELYEIDEAIERIRTGHYGICEVSEKKIPVARLEALPFARYTVECQAEYEKEQSGRNNNQTVRSVFGLS